MTGFEAENAQIRPVAALRRSCLLVYGRELSAIERR